MWVWGFTCVFVRMFFISIMFTVIVITTGCDGNKYKIYSDGDEVYQIKLFCGSNTYEYLTDFDSLDIYNKRVKFVDRILGVTVISTCDFLHQPVLEKIEEPKPSDKKYIDDNINRERKPVEENTCQSPMTINNY